MSEAEKLSYIEYFDEGNNLNNATEEEVEKFREYVDELCNEKNLTAMQIKAYSCYGGNRAYPCDWMMSRNLLLEMMEMHPDPFTANTLGYIYYYGRCNFGEPEYKEAYYYYSIGAAGGVYESMYKMADMFAKGQAVPKSPQIARNIIRDLYYDNHRYITAGIYDCKFADLALRMGNIFTYDMSDPNEAFRYYLQADYAIKKRMEIRDYYGDAKVAKIIQSKLEKTLPETDFVEPVTKVTFDDLQSLLTGTYNKQFMLQMHIKRSKKNPEKFKIKIGLIPRSDYENVPQFFVTVPEAHYCGMMEKISLKMQSPAMFLIGDGNVNTNEAVITFDKVVGNELYLYGSRVAAFETEWIMKV